MKKIYHIIKINRLFNMGYSRATHLTQKSIILWSRQATYGSQDNKLLPSKKVSKTCMRKKLGSLMCLNNAYEISVDIC